MNPRSPQSIQDPRARQLLRTLIARYIRDGIPVGSQTLARHAGLDVSPATIRNILANLEEVGLLASPHTSAGRIPTSQGYRVFVDSLLQLKPLPEVEMARLREELPAGGGTASLLGGGSGLLSAMSRAFSRAWASVSTPSAVVSTPRPRAKARIAFTIATHSLTPSAAPRTKP